MNVLKSYSNNINISKDSEFTVEDKKYMKEACLLCDNSSLEVKTGCLIVSSDGAILGKGWNCEEDAEIIHAEIRALKEALLSCFDINACSIYVSRFPCIKCAEKVVKAGISKVFYMSDHFTSGNSAMKVFKESGICVVKIPEEMLW